MGGGGGGLPCTNTAYPQLSTGSYIDKAWYGLVWVSTSWYLPSKTVQSLGCTGLGIPHFASESSPLKGHERAAAGVRGHSPWKKMFWFFARNYDRNDNYFTIYYNFNHRIYFTFSPY